MEPLTLVTKVNGLGPMALLLRKEIGILGNLTTAAEDKIALSLTLLSQESGMTRVAQPGYHFIARCITIAVYKKVIWFVWLLMEYKCKLCYFSSVAVPSAGL